MPALEALIDEQYEPIDRALAQQQMDMQVGGGGSGQQYPFSVQLLDNSGSSCVAWKAAAQLPL
jgi:hypothetical protein